VICPNCYSVMASSDITIDTSPETYEFHCKCGLALDVCDGRTFVCFRSTPEAKAAYDSKYGAKEDAHGTQAAGKV